MDNDTKGLNREEVVKQILNIGKSDKFSKLEEDTIHEIISSKVSENVNAVHSERLSFGQRLADKIAAFGGSWNFIISFGIVLFSWIIINAFVLLGHAFDPYPFVFLNLILSCLAAIQAPVILMSQNRQSERDRLTANNDFLVNFKSELIIEHLHYKLDELLEKRLEDSDLLKQLDEMKVSQMEILKQLQELKK